MKKLIESIAQYVHVSTELEEALMHSFEKQSVEKKQDVVETGKRCNKLYFVLSGALRTYYYQDGKDVTSWIYPETSFITTWAAFYNGGLTFESIQAIVDTELCSISKNQLQYLYTHFPEMSEFGRLLAEEQLAFLDELNHEFMFADAKQKYDKLLEFFPDITRIGNLGYVASILGINQVTLSRIRKMR